MVYASLPFKRWPKRMILELPPATDFHLNYWCSSGGISSKIPPRQIITGIQLDARLHCQYEFGEYVLAHMETDNTMKPRAVDGIYLRPTGAMDGSFFVLNLVTGQRIRRRTATAAHMTTTIIRRVEELAESEGMPIGLTMTDRNNENPVTIHDMEEASVGSIDKDDNASDASFTPDDESVETTLTEFEKDDNIMPLVRRNRTTNDADDGREDTDQNEMVADAEGRHNGDDNDGTSQCEIENHITGDLGATDTNVISEKSDDEAGRQECEDREEQECNRSVTQECNGGDAEDMECDRSTHEEEIIIEEEVDDSPVNIVHLEIEIEEPIAKRRLRNQVTRINAKTFEPTSHHQNLFGYVAGYARAVKRLETEHQFYSFLQQTVEGYNNLDASPVSPQYRVERGLQEFQEKGTKAVLKELRQIHDMHVITPKHPSEMTKEDIKRALPYLMFLKRKRCGKIKGRGCADGRGQREFISKDEASSPTASLYAIIMTSVIDAIEGRYVVTTDIPGAFLQTEMPEEEVVYIKIVGSMAELLERIDPKLYSQCIVTTRKGKKVLFARANKAIYGTLKAALLFWKKLKGQLEEWGFEQNKYDPCTMNKIINGRQATIVWHVDDLKISHCEKDVVESILEDLERIVGGVSQLSTTRGKVHDYLGMTIDYGEPGSVRFTMFDYLQDVIASLPDDLRTNKNTTTPAADHLITVNPEAKALGKKQAETFHKYVAKLSGSSLT